MFLLPRQNHKEKQAQNDRNEMLVQFSIPELNAMLLACKRYAIECLNDYQLRIKGIYIG